MKLTEMHSINVLLFALSIERVRYVFVTFPPKLWFYIFFSVPLSLAEYCVVFVLFSDSKYVLQISTRSQVRISSVIYCFALKQRGSRNIQNVFLPTHFDL